VRPWTIIPSRRAGRRIDCAASRGGVDVAAFPVALLGLILCAPMIACEDAKADVGMSQPAQQLAPFRVNDAIQLPCRGSRFAGGSKRSENDAAARG